MSRDQSPLAHSSWAEVQLQGKTGEAASPLLHRIVPEARRYIVPEARRYIVPEARRYIVPEARRYSVPLPTGPAHSMRPVS